MSKKHMSVATFAVTSLLGAFLLFEVQPMMGKSLLPWFGGAPLVWTTCMMFFQILLLLGYAYAHGLATWLPRRGQVAVHIAVLALGAAFARVLPEAGLAPSGSELPTLYLLTVLTVTVALPFFALSATAPLVQAWFHGRFPGRSPYPLYALSNLGSLLAVMTYPFFVETAFPLPRQETLWFVGYLVFFAGCSACGALLWRVPVAEGQRAGNKKNTRATDSGAARQPLGGWLGYSACGSVLLLATTDRISQDIAASPLFWVIPLGIYLGSFIWCFARAGLYRRGLWLAALPVVLAAMAAERLFGGSLPVSARLAVYLVSLLVGCMVCHGELAELRPDARHLTRYYFALSLGGASGGVLVALVAPLVLPGMWELSSGWMALSTMVLAGSRREADRAFLSGRAKSRLAMLAVAWGVAAIVLVTDVVVAQPGAEKTYRDFFGLLTISRNAHKRCLYHGAIQHGCQWLDEARADEPTTYYGPGSGVGVAVRALRKLSRDAPSPLRIGVVGLGIGTSAAWGRAGDTMRFYELNPKVVTLAKTRFTYLETSKAAIEIAVGDARITLAREARAGTYPPLDLLVLDAFSGDAIPLHLLTREAFSVYRSRLRPGGILAAHISNQHLKLEPLILGLARDMAGEALLIETGDDAPKLIYGSTWVLVTGDREAVEAVRALGYRKPWPADSADPILFTDQYSNLLELL